MRPVGVIALALGPELVLAGIGIHFGVLGGFGFGLIAGGIYWTLEGDC